MTPVSLDIRAKRAWSWAHALRHGGTLTAALLARHQIARQLDDPHPGIRRLTQDALTADTPLPPAA